MCYICSENCFGKNPTLSENTEENTESPMGSNIMIFVQALEDLFET
jgi:hypothetical protein